MATKPTKSELLKIYANCLKSRYLDERLQEYYFLDPEADKSGAIRTLHCAIGNELGGSAIAVNLKKEDFLIPRYRGYAALLGKGMPAESIAAEILRKKSGTTKGFGDNTLFKDLASNIFGSSSILGSNFSVAIGLAFAKKFKSEPGIIVQLFGDGEASRSTFGSALNLASLWKLPLLFVCENDGISLNSRIEDMSATPMIAERARGYAIESETLQEKEALRLCERVKEKIARIRRNQKPFLLEIVENRFTPSSSLCSKEPFRAMMLPRDKDPLAIFEEDLQKLGINDSALARLKNKAKQSIAEAVTNAENGEPSSLNEFFSIYHE